MSKPKLSYSVREAADATGLSVDTIRAAIRTGRLEARYPTSKGVILATELDRWLEAAPTHAERTA